MRTKRKASPASFSFNNDELHSTETAIVVATSSSSTAAASSFRVPEHWIVEKRKRTRGLTAGLVDKYYYEPETGRKFRSMRSIEKYLLELEGKAPVVKLLGYEKKEKLPKKRKTTTVKSYSSPTSRDPSFKLPEGWLVEDYVRSSGVSAGKVDRYYIDPETGQKFRSLKSIKEFLAESKNNTPALKILPFDEKEKLRLKKRKSISVTGTKATSFNLPEGWVVEEYVRTSGLTAGRVAKVFIEPGTGRKFQSLKSVEMHLSQMDGSLVPTQIEFLPENFNMLSSADVRELEKRDMATGAQSSRTARRGLSFHSTSKEVPFSDPGYDDVIFKSSQSSGPFKNKVCEGMPSSSSNKAPAKIKWLFRSSSGEDRWSPYVGESMVPEPVQQQWAKLFVSTVDEEILMHKFRSR